MAAWTASARTHPVEIHVFDPAGTLASDVLMLLADAVGVFGETVGGLDAVLEEVEERLDGAGAAAARGAGGLRRGAEGSGWRRRGRR